MASQITGVLVVYSIVCSDADQRKHQSSASLAFVGGIRRWSVTAPHKGPPTRKMFPFDDVIMHKKCHKVRADIFPRAPSIWTCHIIHNAILFINIPRHDAGGYVNNHISTLVSGFRIRTPFTRRDRKSLWSFAETNYSVDIILFALKHTAVVIMFVYFLVIKCERYLWTKLYKINSSYTKIWRLLPSDNNKRIILYKAIWILHIISNEYNSVAYNSLVTGCKETMENG